MAIAKNLRETQENLLKDVELIAVSKTKPIADIEEAYAAGQRHFGENRIPEMAEKFEVLPKDIFWHMIGHVQGNKIKYMASFVHMVHGMDKEKRIAELNKEAAKHNRKINALVQIHIAEEESKFGFSYEEAWDFFQTNITEKYPHIEIRGLMGMATLTDDKAKVRQEFAGLKSFFDKVKNTLNLNTFDTLSMGMSGDYKIAMEEGSTMVRIGSSIFGKRS